MSVQNYSDLADHYGHDINISKYTDTLGNGINMAIECEDCYEVLLDFDNEGE
jgi:hypothetical protein